MTISDMIVEKLVVRMTDYVYSKSFHVSVYYQNFLKLVEKEI